MTVHVDEGWLAAHPLPPLDDEADKNGRGRVLIAGGAEFVPGALRLTGEGALRAGAGKLQLATVRRAAMALGVLVPEASMTALPADENGEIATEAADILIERFARCDALVLGPGMSAGQGTGELVARVLSAPDKAPPVVLDAAALTSSRDLSEHVARHGGRMVLTPHGGEMAHLAGCDQEAVTREPEKLTREMAERFNAVVLLKGKDSILADPSGALLHCEVGGVGLATGGSGDVLAGIIGGLLARGASPLVAAAWGSWIHGRAGEILTERIGAVGFLARELLPLIPALLAGRPAGKRAIPSASAESGRDAQAG